MKVQSFGINSSLLKWHKIQGFIIHSRSKTFIHSKSIHSSWIYVGFLVWIQVSQILSLNNQSMIEKPPMIIIINPIAKSNLMFKQIQGYKWSKWLCVQDWFIFWFIFCFISQRLIQVSLTWIKTLIHSSQNLFLVERFSYDAKRNFQVILLCSWIQFKLKHWFCHDNLHSFSRSYIWVLSEKLYIIVFLHLRYIFVSFEKIEVISNNPRKSTITILSSYKVISLLFKPSSMSITISTITYIRTC